MILRALDVFFSALGLVFSLPIMFLLWIVIMIEVGSPFFVQERLGKNKSTFKIFKFRTMKLNTGNMATHLVGSNSLTFTGKYVRRLKLDELPQLINVFLGDMSLVGPRPNLLTQKAVISEREKLNIYNVKPGITGLSQISRIDMSNPKLLAQTDSKMLENLNVISYLKVLTKTLLGKGMRDGVN